MAPEWIGQDAGRMLTEIGVDHDPSVRLLVAEVPRDHSLVWTEQMMPVMPVVRVRNVDDAIDLAVASEHGFRHNRVHPLHQRRHDHPHGACDELARSSSPTDPTTPDWVRGVRASPRSRSPVPPARA